MMNRFPNVAFNVSKCVPTLWKSAVLTGAAVAGGHYETLRWAREHGCPWRG